MATKVPSLCHNLDRGLQRLPVEEAKPKPGGVISAEGEALRWSRLGAKGDEILHSGNVTIPETFLMVLTDGVDREVISQASWLHIHGTHEPDPRMKEIPDDHHADRATLWNTAHLAMWSAQPSADGVVVGGTFMEGLVRSKDFCGKSPTFQEEVHELSLDLVEALPDIRTATGEIKSEELGKLEVQRQWRQWRQ